MFLCLLLDVANFLCYLLQRVLVVGVRGLEVCPESVSRYRIEPLMQARRVSRQVRTLLLLGRRTLLLRRHGAATVPRSVARRGEARRRDIDLRVGGGCDGAE